MKCALVLNNENRIIDFIPADGADETYPRVDSETLPKGEIINYKYVDGEYVYDRYEEPVEEEKPTQLDVLEAQATYTAMMTDTLLEV